MKQLIINFIFILISYSSIAQIAKKQNPIMQTNDRVTMKLKSAYAQVNGIKMYYEIVGEGEPLVLLHGGGSTIQTSFGRIIPLLAKHRQLICVELQAHGRTSDRNTAISFQQDADDVAALLQHLKIKQSDILGFSNGGNTALQIAIRHPEMVRKIIACSVLLKRDGTFPQFWEFMKNGTFEQMPQAYKDAFLAVNPDSNQLHNMYQKCAERMIHFKDFTDEEIKSIKAQVLLINGTTDVANTEHVKAMSKLIPDCELQILAGGHGEYLGEITTIQPNSAKGEFCMPLLLRFLNSD